MNINIASKNPVKVQALEESIVEYPILKNAKIVSIDTPSGVSDQPKNLKETIQGAINRSKGSFVDCNYSFGIESGLMEVPNTKSGYMDVCVCAIFDGSEFHIGLSSAWEAPKEVSELILNEGVDMNEAAYRVGLTENLKIGSAEGLIGIMTKGRLTRKGYTKESIRTAMIHIDKD